MSLAQKNPLARTLPLSMQQKALAEIRKRGRELPGHVVKVTGAIVEVNFDIDGVVLPNNIPIPVIGSEYIRLPIQVGDKGFAYPATTYLGGVTGLGGGIADGTLRGNLSALVWVPVGNAGWATEDPNTLTLYGKSNGVLIKDKQASPGASVAITANSITLSCGGHNIVIDSSGVHIDGKIFLTHTHTGVQTGGSNTGAVT